MVGKTSLLRRFVTGTYDEEYLSTLGTVVKKKSEHSPKTDTTVHMIIWDISGQPEFKRIHASAFKDSAGVLAVCDITRPETAQHLQDWMMTIEEHANKKVPVLILANKSDLEEEYSNKAEMVKVTLDYFGLPTLMTSAKTGYNVRKAFIMLADAIAADSGDIPFIPETGKDITSVQEEFYSPIEFLDYMAILFSKVLSDQEMGMHIVRKQVKDEGFDFREISKEEAKTLIDRLVSIIQQYKGEEVALSFRNELLASYERCKKE